MNYPIHNCHYAKRYDQTANHKSDGNTYREQAKLLIENALYSTRNDFTRVIHMKHHPVSHPHDGSYRHTNQPEFMHQNY